VPAAGDPAIEAIAKIDQRLVVLLDPVALFASAEVRAAATAAAEAEALLEVAA
jgi:hypothetical protein